MLILNTSILQLIKGRHVRGTQYVDNGELVKQDNVRHMSAGTVGRMFRAPVSYTSGNLSDLNGFRFNLGHGPAAVSVTGLVHVENLCSS